MQETGVKYEGQIRERGLYVMDHPSLCALLIRQTVLGPMGPEIHSYCFERNELGTLDIIISISKSGLPENVSEKRSAYLWATMESFLSDNVINVGGLWHTVNFEMFKFRKCLQLKTHEIISRENCSFKWRMSRGSPRRVEQKLSHGSIRRCPLAGLIISDTQDHLLSSCASQVYVAPLVLCASCEMNFLQSLSGWGIIFPIPCTFETCAANASLESRDQQEMAFCT